MKQASRIPRISHLHFRIIGKTIHTKHLCIIHQAVSASLPEEVFPFLLQEINKEIKIKLPNILFLIFIFLISKLNENLWNNLKTYTKYIVFVFLYLPSQPKDNYGKRRKTYCISMAFDCITNACTHCESSPFPQCNRRYFLPFKYSTQP